MPVGDLYRVVFDSALKDLNTPHGRQGYYFAENGEYSQVELAREIGRVMHELGMAKSQAPTKLSDEENMKYLGVSPSDDENQNEFINGPPTHRDGFLVRTRALRGKGEGLWGGSL